MPTLFSEIIRKIEAESEQNVEKAISKIQTDLTRDKGWDEVKELGLKWVNLVSVNDTWSAFALRPYKEGEEKKSWW